MINERQTDLAAEPIITGNIKKAISTAGGRSDDLWLVDPAKCHHDARDNVRPLNMAEVESLAQKMLANGYDKSKPIGGFVRNVDGENRIYIHEGQHRFFAARRAIQLATWADEKLAFDVIPLVLYPAQQVDRKKLIIRGINANGGVHITPLQLAENIAELQREGMTQAEICTHLAITSQTFRDVMLLLDAPADLHDLIRESKVTSTLVIKTIRDVGADKALDVIEKALSVATKDGRTKVTQKNLDLPTLPKGKPAKQASTKAKAGPIAIPDRLAKQLLFAAVAAYNDGDFCEDSPGYVEIMTTLTSLCTLDTEADKTRWIATANEHGMLNAEATETIESPKWGRDWMDISVARASLDAWHATASYSLGGSGRRGPVSSQSPRYKSRPIAIALGAITAADNLRNGGARNSARAVEWLEDLAVRALLGKL